MANKSIDKKYHYLYKTTNLINGKYYYGIHSTNNLDDNYLGSGTYLRNAIHKHGKHNFKREIIEQFDNREDLSNAENKIITKEMIQDKYCMNLMFGGEYFNTIGMVTVKDKEGNCFNVFCNDSRYLSGELVGVTKDYFNVKDKDGIIFQIHKNDERFVSGELTGITKGKITVKDKICKTYHVDIDDERYLSGELVGVTEGFVTVKNKDENTLKVSINDERYLSGELKSIWSGKNHTEETKKKMSESSKGKQIGSKNGSFGSCWITKYSEITKEGINKKIKKEELDQYINDGWSKGRKIKISV